MEILIPASARHPDHSVMQQVACANVQTLFLHAVEQRTRVTVELANVAQVMLVVIQMKSAVPDLANVELLIPASVKHLGPTAT